MPGEVNLEEPTDSEQPLGELDVLEASGINPDIIEAVPEHHGDISAMVERYGDDPKKCPFLNSMGSAGIELYQRLKDNAESPDRGPTMREILEARKRQDVPNPKAIESAQTKSDDEETQHLLAHQPETTESKIHSPENNLPIQDELIREKQVLLQEVLESKEPDIQTEYEEVLEIQPILEAPEIEIVADPVSIFIEPKAIEPLKPVILTVEPESKPVQPPVETVVVAPLYNKAKKKVLITTEQLTKPEVQPEKVEDIAYESGVTPSYSEVTPELIFEESARTTAVEETPISPDIIADALGEIGLGEYEVNGNLEIEEPLFDLMQAVAEVEAEALEPDFLELVVGPVELVEVEAPTTEKLQEQILTYVELLADDETEEPKIYLNELIKLVDSVNEIVDLTPELEATLMEQVELALVQLLESIKLDLDEKLIKAIVSNLVQTNPRASKSSVKYTIDQLNILGTREYKTNTIQPVFTKLLQSLKDKVRARLSIGKYALQASFSV